MVSVLDSGYRGLGSRPGWVNVFCSWARHFTLPCSDASLHPGVKMGTDELSGKPDEMQRESTDIFSNQWQYLWSPTALQKCYEILWDIRGRPNVGKNWTLVYIMAIIIYFSLHNSKYKTKNAWNKALQTGKKVINMYIWLRTRENIFLLFWQTKAVWLVWSLKRSFWIRNNLSWIKKILIKMNSNMIFCGKPKHI